MITEEGIVVSQPSKSATGLLSKTYEMQLLSSRGALLERNAFLVNQPVAAISHDTLGAIPLGITFVIENGRASAAVGLYTTYQTVQPDGFQLSYNRIFYNKATP